MKKVAKGFFSDWIFPIVVSLITTTAALILSDFESNPDSLDSFVKLFIPLVFTYATTMFGLSLACYTLFQTLDNEMVRFIRRWKVYTRFKMYIWHIMILLAILAIMTLVEIFVFEKLLNWTNSKVLLGVPLLLSVLTLVALIHWISLLIRYFDSERERMQG